jgi:hypothetical protein
MKIARFIQSALFASRQVGAIPLKKTIAKLSIDIGLTPEKIMEYLELLESAEQFSIDYQNDKIKKPES